MPLPLLAAGLIAGSGVVSGVYNVKKGLETRKYWDQYYRNTGYRPRYPLRSGYYDIVPALSSGVSSVAGAAGLYGMMRGRDSFSFGTSVGRRRINVYNRW